MPFANHDSRQVAMRTLRNLLATLAVAFSALPPTCAFATVVASGDTSALPGTGDSTNYVMVAVAAAIGLALVVLACRLRGRK